MGGVLVPIYVTAISSLTPSPAVRRVLPIDPSDISADASIRRLPIIGSAASRTTVGQTRELLHRDPRDKQGAVDPVRRLPAVPSRNRRAPRASLNRAL